MRKVLVLTCFLLTCWSCYGQIHDHHGHSHDEPPAFKYSKAANEKLPDDHQPSEKLTKVTSEIWMRALGSTVFISAVPFIIIFLIPMDITKNNNRILKILLSMGAGGLLGDAFLHLIPHASMAKGPDSETHHHGHSHSGSQHDMRVGHNVLFGIITFLIIEKAVRIIKGGHGHSHSTSKNKKAKTETKKAAPTKEIKVSGYLNLAADFSHNFTDGLAIGTSYLAGDTVGWITTISILLHEIPHEMGDFAILVQSGISQRNAVLLQLVTALGALSGTTVSLLVQSNAGEVATQWILPFTAGGFIYIALVTVLPELLEDEESGVWHTVLHFAMFLVGILLMVMVAEFE